MANEERNDVVRVLEELAKIDVPEESIGRALDKTRSALAAAPPKRAFSRRRLVIAALAAGLLLAAGLWEMAGWLQGPGNSAFAEVQETMRRVTTVTYRFTPLRVSSPTSYGSKVKAPASKHLTLDGNHARRESDTMITIIDLKKRATMLLDTKNEKAYIYEDVAMPPENAFDQIRLFKQGQVEQLPDREVDGKAVLCFRTRRSDRGLDTESLVLADRETQLPVRVEVTVTDREGREVISGICDDFQYNVPLDASLFSIEPPPGYTVWRRRANQTQAVEKTADSFWPISPTARVEVRIAEDQPNAGLTEIDYEHGYRQDTLYLHGEATLTAPDFEGVSLARSQDGRKGTYDLFFQLTPAGSVKMASLTAQNVGKQLVILVDGKVILAARIVGIISDKVRVTGEFNKDEAERIVERLEKGPSR